MNLPRLWYYCRVGYGTYFALILGVGTNLVILYKLVIQDIPDLVFLFPHLAIFILFSLATGSPIVTLVGYLHAQRTGALQSEQEISTRANPYNHNLIPGKEAEVVFPILIILAKTINPLALGPKDQRALREAIRKAEEYKVLT